MYEDAVARGHTAITADEEKDGVVSVRIGNLLPGQEATIKFQLLQVLKVERGAYLIRVPMSFFPASHSEYQYTFNAEISGETAITYISAPDEAEVVRQPDNMNRVVIRKSPHSCVSL